MATLFATGVSVNIDDWILPVPRVADESYSFVVTHSQAAS